MSLTKTPPSMIETTGAVAGQVLTYNGSTSTWVASAAPTSVGGGASNITSGTAVSATGTAVDFTAIPSWAKRVTVLFNGISTSGNSNYLIQLGTSGGIQTTGYRGYASTNSTNATSTTGLIITSTLDLNTVGDGLVTIVLMNSSNGTWISSGTYDCTVSAFATACSSASKTLSGILDRIRITTVNGTDTFDAGTINIMWE